VRRALLSLIPDDSIAGLTDPREIHVGHFGRADRLDGTGRQFGDGIVRQEETAGPKHLRNIGDRERLFEEIVVDEDVGGENEIELAACR
jgi:hypothetical protein